jgi:large subunit ribosomal protein L6
MVLAVKIEEIVELPEEVGIQIEGEKVTVSGPKGQVTRNFKLHGITIQQHGKQVKITSNFPRKKEKALITMMSGEIKNMVTGVTQGYKYTLQVIHTHFPITVKVEGKQVLINNFLGEKHPRKSNIVNDAQVQVKGQEITITGTDKRAVGQTATNIVLATQIGRKDQRVFKDGIFLAERGVIDEKEEA